MLLIVFLVSFCYLSEKIHWTMGSILWKYISHFLSFILPSNLTSPTKQFSLSYQTLILGGINYVSTYYFFSLWVCFLLLTGTWVAPLTPLVSIPSLVKLKSISPRVFWRLAMIIYVKSAIIEAFLHPSIHSSWGVLT